MLWLDERYLNNLSFRLPNFKKKGQYLWLWKCTLCGDKKNRSYAFRADDHLRVYCHRCGYSSSFSYFLKNFDPSLNREYLLEAFGDTQRPDPEEAYQKSVEAAIEPPPVFTVAPLRDIQPAVENEAAREFIQRRMIPESFAKKLYYTNDFMSWANSVVPDKYRVGPHDDPRVVIPFLRPDGTLLGFQGRTLKTDVKARYLTISLAAENEPFFFGLDGVDLTKDIRITEGPIDSFFVRNSISTAGGTLIRQQNLGVDKDRMVVCYDNEPRSHTTIYKIEKAISEGFKVFLWPENIEEKDFNDYFVHLINSGKNESGALLTIESMIASRTYSGMEAELQLINWKKR